MNDKDIINFKQSLVNYNVEQLIELRTQLNDNISKMILNSDDVVKVAIIEGLLTEKLNKEHSNE